MTATDTAQPTSIALPATLQRIVLAGFMGAGKSSIGRLLAQALGWDFLDLDHHLEARAGASVASLFATHGEAHFRRLESSALANALARPHTVLALGGGTPELVRNRLLLEQTAGTLVVFLDAPFPVLFDRCMLQALASPDHIRPVLTTPAEAEARFQLRQPLYRRLAGMTLCTEAMSAAESAEALLARLAALAR